MEVASTQKQHDIDTWIDAIVHDRQTEELVASRLDGTCDWILDHPAYIAWELEDSAASDTRILWINAPAGMGKTVIAAWLTQRAEKMLKMPLACCFASNYAQWVNELDGIVRTWLTQLIRADNAALDLVHQMRIKQNSRRASKGDAWSMLRDVLSRTPCVLVLDGLDEFKSENDRRRTFLVSLKNTVQATRSRVLITSRNEFDLESELRTSCSVPSKLTILNCVMTKDDVKDDIDLVSQSIVARKLPKQRDSLRQELAMTMAERCDGQFLWLKLQ